MIKTSNIDLNNCSFSFQSVEHLHHTTGRNVVTYCYQRGRFAHASVGTLRASCMILGEEVQEAMIGPSLQCRYSATGSSLLLCEGAAQEWQRNSAHKNCDQFCLVDPVESYIFPALATRGFVFSFASRVRQVTFVNRRHSLHQDRGTRHRQPKEHRSNTRCPAIL